MKSYPTTDKERSEFWGVKVRTMFRWKGDGAPLDDYEQMLAWLPTRKNLPRSVLGKIRIPAPKNASSHVSGGTAGAAAALKRLEIMELQAFERLQAALARGNPLEIREARENWLRISESLRKYDLMIEDSRRDAGELVPVSEVQTFIGRFITFATVAMTARAESLTNELLGKSEPIEVYARLRHVFDETVVAAVFGYLKGGKSPDPRLTAYAEQRVRDHFAQSKRTCLFDDADQSILALIRWANAQP
jgi:hypothetical protein